MAKKVILIKCDFPLSKPFVANNIAGVGVEFVVVPFDTSMSTPASSSIVTLAIPQRGLIVACQYIAVPIIDVGI